VTSLGWRVGIPWRGSRGRPVQLNSVLEMGLGAAADTIVDFQTGLDPLGVPLHPVLGLMDQYRGELLLGPDAEAAQAGRPRLDYGSEAGYERSNAGYNGSPRGFIWTRPATMIFAEVDRGHCTYVLGCNAASTVQTTPLGSNSIFTSPPIS
jgi:hypothetical protein